MSERGIYELQVWIDGLKMLEAPKGNPDCFKLLGFSDIPDPVALKERWKQMAKLSHPDVGGNAEYFNTIKAAYEQAAKILEGSVK